MDLELLVLSKAIAVNPVGGDDSDWPWEGFMALDGLDYSDIEINPMALSKSLGDYIRKGCPVIFDHARDIVLGKCTSIDYIDDPEIPGAKILWGKGILFAPSGLSDTPIRSEVEDESNKVIHKTISPREAALLSRDYIRKGVMKGLSIGGFIKPRSISKYWNVGLGKYIYRVGEAILHNLSITTNQAHPRAQFFIPGLTQPAGMLAKALSSIPIHREDNNMNIQEQYAAFMKAKDAKTRAQLLLDIDASLTQAAKNNSPISLTLAKALSAPELGFKDKIDQRPLAPKAPVQVAPVVAPVSEEDDPVLSKALADDLKAQSQEIKELKDMIKGLVTKPADPTGLAVTAQEKAPEADPAKAIQDGATFSVKVPPARPGFKATNEGQKLQHAIEELRKPKAGGEEGMADLAKLLLFKKHRGDPTFGGAEFCALVDPTKAGFSLESDLAKELMK